MSAAGHNAALRRGRLRALELEGPLARALVPVLVRAGDHAAVGFQRKATDHLNASARRSRDGPLLASAGVPESRRLLRSLALTAAAPGLNPKSTMVALYPRPEEAAALAADDGEPPELLHVTLAYLGETEETDLLPVVDALRKVALRHAPLVGHVAGVGLFPQNPGSSPGILLPSVPGLVEARVEVTEALIEAGADYSRDYGYVPHITAGYGAGAPPAELAGQPLHFDHFVLARGDAKVTEIPLTGAPPLTAAADPYEQVLPDTREARAAMDAEAQSLRVALKTGDQEEIRAAKERLDAARLRLRRVAQGGPRLAAWTAPAMDEIVDAEALAASFRGKTDPVRLAAIEQVAKATLDGAGIDYQVTNPFIQRVLEKAGGQVTAISETTRANVNAIIAESYDAGLSIPDTAAAIRAGMLSATWERATLIARTELVGAVSGGSQAAVQMAASVTGDSYDKEWLTASGARNPRHEEYDGLDGQTVPLDGYFDVGGAQLEYPGDPNGPPEEVCNCRCTAIYHGAGGEEEVSAE